MVAQCELKAAGKPYPRTCPVCKLGPCQRRESRVFTNAQVVFEGRRNGMNEPDPNGPYAGFSVSPDRVGGKAQYFKFSVASAEAFARDLLRNT